ncbi:hypothetical protein [Cetobacterium sp. SF1]
MKKIFLLFLLLSSFNNLLASDSSDETVPIEITPIQKISYKM